MDPSPGPPFAIYTAASYAMRLLAKETKSISAFTASILSDGVITRSQRDFVVSATPTAGQGSAGVHAPFAASAATMTPASAAEANAGAGTPSTSPLEMIPIKKTKRSPVLIHCFFPREADPVLPVFLKG